MTYFDNLGDVELEHIFRRSMASTRRPYWIAGGDKDCLRDVSRPNHPLRATAQKMVKELNHSSKGGLAKIDEEDILKILDAFGSNCNTLSVFSWGHAPKVWPCGNLKVLRWSTQDDNDAAFSIRYLLEATPKLEELELEHGRRPCPADAMEAVAEYGARLRKLFIYAIDLEQGDTITRMLQATGPTLLSLEIFYMGDVPMFEPQDQQSLFDIKAIFHLCPLVTGHFICADTLEKINWRSSGLTGRSSQASAPA